MFAEERQQQILIRLRLHGSVTVPDLATQFGVSEHTIRRDLNVLHGQGHLQKTHGGAVSLDTTRLDWNGRVSSLPEAKASIGAAAARLVAPGDTVMLDASSTTVALARALQGRPLTVITNSLAIASLFETDTDVTLIVTGGVWQPNAKALWGEAAQQIIRHYRADWAFLGACAVDVHAGITVTDATDATLKRAMVASARQVAVLADHSKRDRVVPHHVMDLGDVDALITDQPWPDVAALGVQVLTASPQAADGDARGRSLQGAANLG